MKFQVARSTQGAVAREAPCPGAERGAESSAWPGEYEWFIELTTLEELLAFLQTNGGALGLFAAEEGDEHPGIEIFDDEGCSADED